MYGLFDGAALGEYVGLTDGVDVGCMVIEVGAIEGVIVGAAYYRNRDRNDTLFSCNVCITYHLMDRLLDCLSVILMVIEKANLKVMNMDCV